MQTAGSNPRGSHLLHRVLAVLLGCAVSLIVLGGVTAAYNNNTNPCGKWSGGGYNWKWGTSINPAGNWAAAFANAASNWKNASSLIWNNYNASAFSRYDWYYDQYDGRAGQAWVNCGFGWPDGTIDDVTAYGNLFWQNDISYTTGKYNVAGHEIGHTYGLGHSTAGAAVMNDPVYLGSWPTADDLAGIDSLY